MKTLHRIMFERLTLREYKKFCKYIQPLVVRNLLSRPHMLTPSVILTHSFDWSASDEGHAYWVDVCDRLIVIEGVA